MMSRIRCCVGLGAVSVWVYPTLIQSLVCPELEYCTSIWDPHKQENIQTLGMVNRRSEEESDQCIVR